MAYDVGVAERLRETFAWRADVVEKKCSAVPRSWGGHIACGVVKDKPVVRVGAEQYQLSLAHPFANEMDVIGKPLNGFVAFAPNGFDADRSLADWVLRGVDFVLTPAPKKIA